ncbi:unnamed protein product [Calypogeia fissa]
MSRSRVLCKYFMHGACLKGDNCEFSHDWSDPASNICTFYQRGYCSYGNRCRYEHVKLENTPLASTPSRVLNTARKPSVVSSSTSKPVTIRNPVSVRDSTTVGRSPVVAVTGGLSNKGSFEAEGTGEFSRMQVTGESPESGWQIISESQEDELFSIEQEMEVARLVDDNDSEDEPICASAASGRCSHGASCKYLHGDLCPTCGKHCLHPLRTQEREEHLRVCAQNRKRLEALLISQDIECTVCLERVLAKPVPAERKFGILSGCDHPFCISCVRGWRSGSHAPGMDIKTVVRACPVCRVVSHYVIPSVTWFSTAEEKEEIVNGYKKKLSSLDCRYFDYGNGTCPFGTSCFYKHAYRDGRLEEIKLRHLGAADGSAVIAKNIRLSDFLGKLNLEPGRS